MSVIATYARLPEPAIERLRANPEWLGALWEGRVADATVIDVDKACDGIVWLLSKLPPPSSAAGAGFTMARSHAPLLRGQGGQKEPRLNAPYGPAQALSVRQVADLSQWLATVSLDQIRAAYAPAAMEADQVYPDIWTVEGLTALDDYLIPNFERLRQFFGDAGREGQSVLVFFT